MAAHYCRCRKPDPTYPVAEVKRVADGVEVHVRSAIAVCGNDECGREIASREVVAMGKLDRKLDALMERVIRLEAAPAGTPNEQASANGSTNGNGSDDVLTSEQLAKRWHRLDREGRPNVRSIHRDRRLGRIPFSKVSERRYVHRLSEVEEFEREGGLDGLS